MRSFFLTGLLTLTMSVSIAQINEGNGIFPLGSCNNDTCNWVLEGEAGADSLWHFGTPKKILPYSGSNCWITDSTKSYGDGRDDYFTVALPWETPENLVLGFWHWFDTDSLNDGGIVEVSFDKGTTYENVLESLNGLILSGTSPNFYTMDDTLFNGMTGFSGNSGGWIYSRIQWVWVLPVKDIPDSVFVRFRFVSDSNGNSGNGWAIDDMDITMVNFPGAIADPDQRIPMKLSPNPAHDRVRVNFESKPGKAYQIRVVDLMGGEVSPQQHVVNDSDFPLDELSSGTYWILLEEDGLLVGREMMVKR